MMPNISRNKMAELDSSEQTPGFGQRIVFA